MKKIKFLITIILAFQVISSNAQIFGNDPEITIEGLQPESAWQIAEMAMLDNSISLEKFSMKEGVLISGWIEWTAIAIQNHAHLYLKYEAPVMTVKIADRQYKSADGWSEAVGNLSKKKYKEYVQNVADRITEINKDPGLTEQAVKNSKLILAFNPVFAVEGLEFKLMKVNKDANQHLLLEFTVHNRNPNKVTIDIPMIEFQDRVAEITGASGNIKWNPSGSQRRDVIQPDETLSLACYYNKVWEMNSIPQFDMRVICNEGGSSDLHTMPIYSVPTSYTNQIGD